MVKKRKPNTPNKTGFLITQVLAELPVCCPDIYDLLGEQVNAAPSPSWHHSGLASLSPDVLIFMDPRPHDHPQEHCNE